MLAVYLFTSSSVAPIHVELLVLGGVFFLKLSPRFGEDSLMNIFFNWVDNLRLIGWVGYSPNKNTNTFC